VHTWGKRYQAASFNGLSILPGRGRRLAYAAEQAEEAVARAEPRQFMCARHIVCLRGERPLRAGMTRTASRSKGVGREAESEGSGLLKTESQTADLTNRNRIEGRGRWSSRLGTAKPAFDT